MDLINTDKLIQLCNKYTFQVSFNGLELFCEQVINAKDLFENLHTASEHPQEYFINQINEGNKPPFVKELFDNLEYQGHFKIAGFEAIDNDPFIRCSKLSFIDNQKNS